jgi:DNA-binding NarL/FixJ family response regulator
MLASATMTAAPRNAASRSVPTTVVLVDDHDMLRAGVRDFLVAIPEYELSGEAKTARDALPLIESRRPDIVLMDLAMPEMDGIAATREILRRLPRTRIVVLTAHGQSRNVAEAIDAGVIGFVLKGDPPDTLKEALDHAVRGDFYMPPSLRGDMASLEALTHRRS